MFITGIGTTAPRQRYTQLQCWGALEAAPQFPLLTPRSRAILKKILTGANGISARHLALDPLTEAFALSPDVLHGRFLRHAPQLAAEAALRAMRMAGTAPGQVDAVIISTCTGYLCPGLTSYVGEILGLRDDVFALDLVGQGCGAAVPNLRVADALLRAGPSQCVLSVCVEVCSAAFYLDNDPGVLISACLFGDGAAAVIAQPGRAGILAGGTTSRTVELKTTRSLHSPQDRELLRFETKGGMLRNILSPCVPVLAGRRARALFDQTCGVAGIKRGNITGWVLHGGGREVLQSLCEHLELQPGDTEASASVLEEYGNVSSPFVLFALQSALVAGKPGGLWWLSSFGAGFSCHGALLEVQ